MIHTINTSFPLLSYNNHYIDCKNIYTLAKVKNIKPVEVDIDSFQHKEISSINQNHIRYIQADTSKPIILVSFDNKLRMIDGRHRLKKIIANNKTSIPAYIVPIEDVIPYIQLNRRH
jgi:hypothetical protein